MSGTGHQNRVESIGGGGMTGGDRRPVGEEHRVTVAGLTVYRGRRRPSGDPAGVRRELRRSAYLWGAAMLVVAVMTVWAVVADLDPPWFGIDSPVSRWLADVRTAWLVDIADGLEWLGSVWSLRVALWSGAAVLVAFRRWRQLFVMFGVAVVVEFLTTRAADIIARPRPTIGAFEGFAHPSATLAGLAAVLVALGYSLMPGARARRLWFLGSTAVVVVAAASRVYLGASHLTDVVVGAMGGAAAAVAAFTVFVPDEAFPVDYRRHRAAHLPVSGARGVRIRRALQEQLLTMKGPGAAAMRRALQEQLGCDVVRCELVGVTPFGLAGSAGSTPLRITVEGRHNGDLFAKLYSTNHLRSDRWYKLGRATRYGRLEDERPYSSVRRLVEYEDYMLRVMDDAGLPSSKPHGIVQIVPGREYLIVTEFFEGSVEIDEATVDEAIVDDALGVVRRLWDAGLAHRDLKPANLLVQNGRVKLIDVAFGEIRPTPWRQAVDLANMMLILGLHGDPEVVYSRALRLFDARDIAEGFAATRGLTVPSQLRSMLKAHKRDTGVDLIEAFRALAPNCPPIAIQRWGIRRVALAASTLAGTVAMVALVFWNLRFLDLL